MARQAPSSSGGKALAVEVVNFMKANIDDMKASGAKREAPENEKIGIEDLANAIVYAIETLMKKNNFAITTPPSSLANGGGPVNGGLSLGAGAPYNFKV
jgi:hypothetical protein